MYDTEAVSTWENGQFRCICVNPHEDMVAAASASFSNLQGRSVPLGKLRTRKN